MPTPLRWKLIEFMNHNPTQRTQSYNIWKNAKNRQHSTVINHFPFIILFDIQQYTVVL